MTDLGSLRDRLHDLKLYGLVRHFDDVRAEPWLASVVEWEEETRRQRSLDRRLRLQRPTQRGQHSERTRTAFRRNADSVSSERGHFGGSVVTVSAIVGAVSTIVGLVSTIVGIGSTRWCEVS
jgi:hypothetical protein